MLQLIDKKILIFYARNFSIFKPIKHYLLVSVSSNPLVSVAVCVKVGSNRQIFLA